MKRLKVECTRCGREIVPFDPLKPRWNVWVKMPGEHITAHPLCEECQAALCEWVLHHEKEEKE